MNYIKGAPDFPKESLNVNGAAYVTKDPLVNFVRFYKDQNGMRPISKARKGPYSMRVGWSM